MTAIRHIAALLLASGIASQASTLQFSFETPDSLGASSLNAYWFPRTQSERRSPRHAATAWRDSNSALSGAWSAHLAFVLDGSPYPSAGVGFQFPEGASIDLRSLTALRITLRSNRKRSLRVSFASRATGYDTASDTGANIGYESTVPQDTTVTWSIDVHKLAYPKWLSNAPNVSVDAVLAQATAIQLTASCASDSCHDDSGDVRIDDIVLEGVDGSPPIPAAGNCPEGNGRLLSDFSQPPYRQNALGGWWYTYTDSSSGDLTARGSSLVLDSNGVWNTKGWRPDTAQHIAAVSFWLRRSATYSGYAALETQLTKADSGVSLPSLHSIAFTLAMDSGFPDTVASIIFHAKKAGSAYLEGRDHQVRIPYRKGATRWCLSLDSLQQPDWVGLWKDPFTPDSLLAFTWEVRLASTLTQGHAHFSLDSIVLHDEATSSITPHEISGTSLRLLRQAGTSSLLRAKARTAARVALFSTDGRRLQTLVWPSGSYEIRLPDSHVMRIAHVLLGDSQETLLIPGL